MNQDVDNIEIQIKGNINFLISSGKLEEAKILTEEYKKLAPGDIEIYSMNAIILIIEKKYEEAEIIIKMGLQEDESNFDLLFNLGYLYELKNNIPEANAIYNIAEIVNSKVELKEVIENKILKTGKPKIKYNIILFGDYNICLKFKESIKAWNVVAIFTDKNIENVVEVSNISKYNYDFIFVVENLDKEEVYEKLRIYNNKNIYFMEDFSTSIIEGTDYKFLKLFSKKQIDGIITGLSYAEVGIKEKLLQYNFINFAFSSQDLFYDFLLLKYIYQFEEVKKSLKYVIINLSYYSFDYDMTKTIAKYRIHRYSRYFREYHSNKDIMGIDITKIFYDKRITFSDYINMNEIKGKSILDINDKNGIYEAKKNSSMNHLDTRCENERILENYLNFLKQNNIKPILVICPTSYHYREYFDNNKKRTFYSILHKINRKYSFQIIDYFESNSFGDKDFWDFSHLNGEGAEKFTKILNKEMQW